MKLIGAGLPRTATLSQKIALEMLGVGPCYHMVNVTSDLDRIAQWSRAFAGEPDWPEIFAGCNSMVDWPGSFYYRELIEAYPDAKVLLSVRPGDAWVRSMEKTICAFLYGDNLMNDLSAARARIDPRWGALTDLMKAMWKRTDLLDYGADGGATASAAAMERYNDEVAQSVDRLLVWSPADGWEPLCEFLEVPVPDAPFPHVNDTEGFVDRIVGPALDALTEWRERQAAPSAL
jgi:Sulfotransferase domain